MGPKELAYRMRILGKRQQQIEELEVKIAFMKMTPVPTLMEKLESLLEATRYYHKTPKKRITKSTPERLAYTSAYRKTPEYRQRRNQQIKLRASEDIVFRLSRIIRSMINQAFKNKGFGKGKLAIEILGCDFPSFKKHIEDQFSPGMHWDNHGEWHLDHIIPLATAKTPEQLIELNYHKNLQPLWAIDNLRKGKKLIY